MASMKRRTAFLHFGVKARDVSGVQIGSNRNRSMDSCRSIVSKVPITLKPNETFLMGMVSCRTSGHATESKDIIKG
jgi:hypothetical protein